MFGFVTANWEELTPEQRQRYTGVYCGICRGISRDYSQTARLTLSYDMAFLALLHMSLYEPEETSARFRCLAHPVHHRTMVDTPFVRHAADMNVALAYYKALDDWRDEKKLPAKLLAEVLGSSLPGIRQRWPRQCDAIARCLEELSALEAQGEPNPDVPAGVFGSLMAELMVFREDLWAGELRRLGFQLGRFIYLADAMLDYDRDARKKSYNPFLAGGREKDPVQWEQYLLLAMGRCTESYEKLPLVQDKALLDNILYSGIWVQYRSKQGKEDPHGSGSL